MRTLETALMVQENIHLHKFSSKLQPKGLLSANLAVRVKVATHLRRTSSRRHSLVRQGSLSMNTCPHCSIEIHLKEIPYQGVFKNFRICPACGGSFTPDTHTKRRQAAFIFISVISLAMTLLLYFRGTEWLIPAIVSYVIGGGILYIGNTKLYFVPYQKKRKSADDT